MSKYIKIEDAISKIVNTPTRVITDDLTALVDRQHEIIDMLSDLPTIEVGEDCISKGYLEQEIENQAMTVEKDKEYWRGWNNALDKVVELIEDAPSVVPQVPSKDCISREWVKGICENMLDEEMLGYMLGHIEDAPSVVPTVRKNRQVGRAEGKWIINEPIESGFGTIFECPYCKYEVEFEPTNYCPNCGAKMKGADND